MPDLIFDIEYINGQFIDIWDTSNIPDQEYIIIGI